MPLPRVRIAYHSQCAKPLLGKRTASRYGGRRPLTAKEQSKGDVALISVHPVHVQKIMSGEKNLEFRRIWPMREIETLVVYATHPEQRLAAIVQVAGVVRASKTALWQVASAERGGITRQALFDYLQGRELGVAIRLGERVDLGSGVLHRPITSSQPFKMRNCAMQGWSRPRLRFLLS